MIEITDIRKSFGDKHAVDGISFTVAEGEIMGFLGPNGAGKSTTLNIITGYLSADSGVVKIDGTDILSDPIKAKKDIGFLPEIPPLYPEMTVAERLQASAQTAYQGNMRGREDLGCLRSAYKKPFQGV